jgi:hypothetical protein
MAFMLILAAQDRWRPVKAPPSRRLGTCLAHCSSTASWSNTQKINKQSRRPSTQRREQDRSIGIDNCSGMTMLGQRPIMLRLRRDYPQDGAVNRQHSPSV